MNKAVFMDRDGTMIEEANYLSSPDQVRWIPGVKEVLSKLKQQGWLLIMITNQSGAARGYFTIEDINKVHAYMQAELKESGSEMDAVYFCPHHPEYSKTESERHCSCRKPNPGMYLQAQKDFNIDMSASAAFGDKIQDLTAPAALGCRVFLVQTGYGKKSQTQLQTSSIKEQAVICRSLAEGAALLLNTYK